MKRYSRCNSQIIVVIILAVTLIGLSGCVLNVIQSQSVLVGQPFVAEIGIDPEITGTYRLYLGIQLPSGWAVVSNPTYTDGSNGVFTYNPTVVSSLNTNIGIEPNTFWWGGEGPVISVTGGNPISVAVTLRSNITATGVYTINYIDGIYTDTLTWSQSVFPAPITVTTSPGYQVYLPLIMNGSGEQQLGAPTLVNPPSGSIQAKPRFDWTDVAGATNYRFQMSPSNTFDVLTINQIVTKSEFTFLSNLTGTYYWRVYTIGSNSTSSSSEVRTIQLVNYSGDDDNDSLLNGWELHGYDPNNDGSPEVNLPTLGASYRHKDIFVEMDYMTRASAVNGLGPNQAVLDKIVAVFNNAAVSNPDGIAGIKIHLELDDKVTYDDDLNPVDDEFYALKNVYFNSNRAAVYHYMIWGDRYNGTTSSGLSFGIPATDFIVTLGAFEGEDGGTDEEKIGTFIHELGHNLGLRHGGSDNVNYKPNYLSIMSYQWQLSGVWRNGQYVFDYQPFSLPVLDENDLDESDGLNGGAVWYWTYRTKHYCGNTYDYKWAQADIAIDWNCDGDSDDSSIVVDTNYDDDLSTLSSHNDWMNINYSGGGIIGSGRSPGELLSQSENYVDPHLDELTYELYLEQLKRSPNTPPHP